MGIIAIELAMGEPPLLRLSPLKAMVEIAKAPSPQLDAKFSTNY